MTKKNITIHISFYIFLLSTLIIFPSYGQNTYLKESRDGNIILIDSHLVAPVANYNANINEFYLTVNKYKPLQKEVIDISTYSKSTHGKNTDTAEEKIAIKIRDYSDTAYELYNKACKNTDNPYYYDEYKCDFLLLVFVTESSSIFITANFDEQNNDRKTINKPRIEKKQNKTIYKYLQYFRFINSEIEKIKNRENNILT